MRPLRRGRPVVQVEGEAPTGFLDDLTEQVEEGEDRLLRHRQRDFLAGLGHEGQRVGAGRHGRRLQFDDQQRRFAERQFLGLAVVGFLEVGVGDRGLALERDDRAFGLGRRLGGDFGRGFEPADQEFPQQARHPPGQPQPDFGPVMRIDPQQQAILVGLVAEVELVQAGHGAIV